MAGITKARPRTPIRGHIGYASALFRFMFDWKASIFAKLLTVLAIAYLFWPIDLAPDVIPVLGWLDDLGFMGVAMGYLAKTVARYKKDYNANVDAVQSGWAYAPEPR